MKVVIVSGGKPPKEEILKGSIDENTYIICADSGANCLMKYNITPNILLGDFDSISEEAKAFFIKNQCNINNYPSEKDFTDTEAALSEALKLNPKEIVFLGCTGSRIDHMLANIGLLYRCVKANIKAVIIDENNTICLYDKSFSVKGNIGETFSLHSFGDTVVDLSIIGAKYELHNYDLRFGDPRTVSNEFLDREVNVNFKSGIIMLFRIIEN